MAGFLLCTTVEMILMLLVNDQMMRAIVMIVQA